MNFGDDLNAAVSISQLSPAIAIAIMNKGSLLTRVIAGSGGSAKEGPTIFVMSIQSDGFSMKGERFKYGITGSSSFEVEM